MEKWRQNEGLVPAVKVRPWMCSDEAGLKNSHESSTAERLVFVIHATARGNCNAKRCITEGSRRFKAARQMEKEEIIVQHRLSKQRAGIKGFFDEPN